MVKNSGGNMLKPIILHIFSTSLNRVSQFVDGIKRSLSSEMPSRGLGLEEGVALCYCEWVEKNLEKVQGRK
jgi:hypothetical protein